jgi:hypothetical protein
MGSAASARSVKSNCGIVRSVHVAAEAGGRRYLIERELTSMGERSGGWQHQRHFETADSDRAQSRNPMLQRDASCVGGDRLQSVSRAAPPA